MANLSLREVNQSKLETTPIVEGQLVFCYDTGNIYHDTASGRTQVGHDVFNVTELPLAPLNGKVYCLPNGEMWLYLGDWVRLNYKYGVATETEDGLQSAEDKKKLNGIDEGANKYTLPAATDKELGGVRIGANITATGGTVSLTNKNVTDALGYVPPEEDTWRGVQNNLDSEAADESLAAAQGKALKGMIDDKAPKDHKHTEYYDVTEERDKGTVLAAPPSTNGPATFRALAKTDVGLDKVDNTADSEKEVKSAVTAQSAEKAVNDAQDQAITGYIRKMEVDGRVVTYTRGDGTTGEFTTQDTTYNEATQTVAGLMSAADKEKTDAIVLDKLCMHDSEETTLEEYKSTCDYIDGGAY